MYLLPTLNRIEKLSTFLKAAKETNMTEPCVLLVDQDDYDQNNHGYINLEFPHTGFYIHVTKAVKMADKVREFLHKNQEPLKYVALLNDDHVPITMNWDTKLVSRLDGKNFVSPNCRTPDRRAFAMPVTATVWSMPLVDAVGFPIYPAGMNHLFVDNLWMHLGKATGCWRMCAEIIVEHHHVVFGKAAEDDTHRKVYAQDAWNHDQDVFNKFMQTSFNETVAKIRKLQDCLPIHQYNSQPSREKLAPPEAQV